MINIQIFGFQKINYFLTIYQLRTSTDKIMVCEYEYSKEYIGKNNESSGRALMSPRNLMRERSMTRIAK